MSWGTAAVTGAGLAYKGARWGYGKIKESREGKRCVRQIIEDAAKLSPEEERILRCAARKLCAGKAETLKEAKKGCRRS
jgi:hypothetical protein